MNDLVSRIPLLRRPFFQRDQAIRQRDNLSAQLRATQTELNAVKSERDSIIAEAVAARNEADNRIAKLEERIRVASMPRVQIKVVRGDRTWTITPDVFEAFKFRHGDELTVTSNDDSEKLPVTWGDTNIQVSPGQAIRVPARYESFSFMGFDIPSHLISLTGAGPETLGHIGRRHIELYDKFCGIREGMTVIDVGCGIGRDAFQLFDTFKDGNGKYIGIDVTRDSIVWCQDNITPKHPNFEFYHFDAENELYNPHGKYTSLDFVFPVPDGSVDRIFLASVFTHLFEEEVLHYMKEFARVLKPDGQVYATFFLHSAEALEAAKSKGTTPWKANFDIPLSPGVFANDPTFPRGAVAFTDSTMRRMISEAGLRLVKPYLKGSWSGLHAQADDGQDVAILGR